MKSIYLFTYYHILCYLPSNQSRLGKIIKSKRIRYNICKHIFKYIGKNVNIEKGVSFGNGANLEIGDNSGIGINSTIPNNTKIGSNVMIGPNLFILDHNHSFSRIDIPMIKQGKDGFGKKTIIEDDVWIGRDVTFTVGRYVSKGSIVAACTLLCKDFPEYSIIGGNPSKLIRSRLIKQ